MPELYTVKQIDRINGDGFYIVILEISNITGDVTYRGIGRDSETDENLRMSILTGTLEQVRNWAKDNI